jgi:hypothetical protein
VVRAVVHPTMNAESIAEYVTKLETLHEESREKIEQLKKLLTQANDERVLALEELNSFRDKKRYKSLYDTTTKPLIGSLLGDDDYDSAEDSDYVQSDTTTEESIEETDDEDEFFTSYNNDIYDMLIDLAADEKSNIKRMAYHRAADAVFYLPYRIASARELAETRGPNKVAGIGPRIAQKIDDFLAKGKSPNKKLADLFLKIGNLEESQFKSEAYWNAAEILKSFPDKIIHGWQVENMHGFGKSICAKIDEFTQTGKIKRLDELK